MTEPVSLADLLSKKPSTHTDKDIKEIIKILREARHKFVLGNKQAGSQKTLTGEAAKVASIELDIKL